MSADYPTHDCGGQLEREYFHAPAVLFNSPGFYATDVNRMRSAVGPENYARFEAQKNDIELRARRGKLTAREKRLERVVNGTK